MMSMQKALFFTAQNGDWVIRDRPIPKAPPGHVVIRNVATSLNPADWMMRAYGLHIQEYPSLAGLDAAGTIEEIGEGAVQWRKGDRVLYQGNFDADKHTFQQYCCIPADIVGRLPENVSFEAGSTVPMALMTAAAGLYQYKGSDDAPATTPSWLPGGEGKYAGKAIAVLGGSSSVGQYVIQLAKLSGFSPIITTASLHNEDLLKSLGATHVINRSSCTLVADILTVLGSLNASQPNIVYDAVSNQSTQETALEILAPGGVLSVVLSAVVEEKAAQEGKHVFKVTGSAYFAQKRDFAYALFASLLKLLEEEKIKPNVYEVLPNGLDGIKDGLQRLQNKEVSAIKLVAHPFDTK